MAAVLIGPKEVLVIMIVTAIVVFLLSEGENAGELVRALNTLLICVIPIQVLRRPLLL
jgi:riboflavin transporter FmnP